MLGYLVVFLFAEYSLLKYEEILRYQYFNAADL